MFGSFDSLPRIYVTYFRAHSNYLIRKKSKMRLLWLVSFTITFLSFVSCKKHEDNKPPLANAGETYSIQLPKDTVRLTGFGTDVDGSVVGYSWSQTDGPQLAAITTPNQASTFVGNLREGKFVFRLTVTDNNGATGSGTVSVIVMPSLIDTLTLQPNTNPNEVAIAGNDYGYEATNPQWTEVLAQAWTKGGEPLMTRNALAFDLSGIPANATIERAELSLYSSPYPQNGDLVHANFGPDNTLLIQRITTPWNAGSARWTNQPSSTTEDQYIAPLTTSSFLDLTDIDVTAMVAKMISSNQNYGFLIKLQTEHTYNSRIFCSSRYSDVTRHPKLIVVYKKH
jgi:hypothetical protein